MAECNLQPGMIVEPTAACIRQRSHSTWSLAKVLECEHWTYNRPIRHVRLKTLVGKAFTEDPDTREFVEYSAFLQPVDPERAAYLMLGETS